ncbi:hypothetical protein [Gemella haemolysans]|uniref:hypothetical protein n=1 Tax=Gemella haemolysans TaxID=1379 RepID=UPI0019564598|nr:hypothetical protein [Gemella haemolysans]VTX78746.1 Uncharacterised protein [Gemella haemolysans]
MNVLEILLEVFPLIFCIFYLMIFGISREIIKKEKILLTKLSDQEIEYISTKNTNSKIFLMLNLGVAILCCIYLVISIVNKGLLIGFFGETLNKVINSIIIVIILLPYLFERINVIRRYNKVKKLVEKK